MEPVLRPISGTIFRLKMGCALATVVDLENL